MAKAKAVSPTSGSDAMPTTGMSIVIPPIKTQIIEIEIEGTSQLIVSAWSNVVTVGTHQRFETTCEAEPKS